MINKNTENIMNIANIITIFRVILIFPTILFVISPVPFHFVYAFLLFALASYTDHLDGKIARKFGYITNFGKIMDPLADKLMILSMLGCFLCLGCCPLLPVILIFLREALITIARIFVLRNNKKVIPANNWGKLKTVSQIIVVCFILLFQIFREFKIIPFHILGIFGIFCTLLLWLSVVFSWISGIIYLRRI